MAASGVRAHASEPAPHAAPERLLDPATPVERELLPGQTHSYGIDLAAGQFLRLRAEQKTVDVALVAVAPDGRVLAELDTTEPGWAGGPERLALIAEAGGRFRLDVRAVSSVASAGTYRLSVEELRDAGADDVARVQAERAFGEGVALSQPDTYADAERRFAEARGLFQAAHDRAGEAAATEYQAGVRGSLGDFDEGLRLRNEARAIYHELGSREQEAHVVLRIANGYLGLGEWQRALDDYEQARALFDEAGQRAGEAFLLLSIGSVHFRRLGDQARALEHFERALLVSREAGDRQLEASALDWIGNVQRARAEYPLAQESYERSLRVAQAAGSTFQEAMALSRLGALQAALGDAEQAVALHGRALELARLSENSNRGGTDVVLLVLRSFAESYERLGRYAEALEQGRAAVARAGQNRALADKVRYYVARLARDRGDLVEAEREISAVLESVEARRGRVLRDASRASLQDETHEYFELAIDVLMRQHRLAPEAGHAALALQVAERMRARTLLDLLGEAGVEVEKDLEPALRERESAARRALDRAASHRGAPAPAATDAEIRRLTEEYESARAEIRRRSPRYAALTDARLLRARQIQELLDPQTVLLEYALGAERSHLWVVSASDLQAYELGPRAEIEEAALDLWRRLSARPGSDRAAAALRRAAARVSSLVLSPAADRLRSASRFLVVADGALQALPFGVLPLPGGGSDGPLVLEHELVGLPSASVLSAVRAEVAARPSAPKAVAVLADPVFEARDPRVRPRGLAAAPPTAGLRERVLERALEAAALRAGQIPRLPFTRREAAAAVGPEPRSAALAALDFDANWNVATGGTLGQYRIVHFASHGLLDAQHPELSGIVLSLVDSSGRPQAGFLGLTDVYDLRLAADLVVLSGCQTGLGRQLRGEGLLGLTRGFMHAGAARVVSSLWKVDDRATAELMVRFYRALRGRPAQAPAAALRAAQASMAQEPRWRAPYYWGGFVLQGEWR